MTLSVELPQEFSAPSLREINRQSGQSQLFHENFQNNVRNVFLQGLSPFKTDLECLNQFSEVFSVGQSSGFMDIF